MKFYKQKLHSFDLIESKVLNMLDSKFKLIENQRVLNDVILTQMIVSYKL